MPPDPDAPRDLLLGLLALNNDLIDQKALATAFRHGERTIAEAALKALPEGREELDLLGKALAARALGFSRRGERGKSLGDDDRAIVQVKGEGLRKIRLSRAAGLARAGEYAAPFERGRRHQP